MGAGIKKIDKGFSHRNLEKVIWRGEIPPIGYQTVLGEKNYVPNDKYTDLKNPYIYPLLQSTFQVGNMTYVPTSLTEATCDILDYTSNNIADSTLYIDKQVTHLGQSFKVKNICPTAFYKNQGIKKLSINIEGKIGDMAFKNCSNLESLTINSLSSIGKDAFSLNTKLKHTSLNNHINSIGENAFGYCEALQHFTIPDSVSVIERKVFKFCSSLEDIVIHKNIKMVKSEAFYSCKNLSVVTIEDQEDTIKFEKNSSFNYCNIDPVYIGANIYNSIFDNTTELPFKNHKTLRAIRISGKKKQN